MGSIDQLIVQIHPSGDTDDEEVVELTRRLRSDLQDLDIESIDSVPSTAPVEGVKGAETLVGWLAVCPGMEGLRSVIAAVLNWATRTGHSVEVTYNGETLKVSAATSAQQDRIINDVRPRVRATGVAELAELLTIPDPDLARAVRETLQNIAESDIPSVAEVARAALEASLARDVSQEQNIPIEPDVQPPDNLRAISKIFMPRDQGGALAAPPIRSRESMDFLLMIFLKAPLLIMGCLIFLLGFLSVGTAIGQRSDVPHLGPGNWIAFTISLLIVVFVFLTWFGIVVDDADAPEWIEITAVGMFYLGTIGATVFGWLIGSHIGLAHLGFIIRDWLAWRF
jgi:hypothetical protein